MSVWEELAELGSATVHEAAGRSQVVDLDLVRADDVAQAHAGSPAAVFLTVPGTVKSLHVAGFHTLSLTVPGTVKASTQPRVSVNWWNRTACPSRNRQTWANGTSSGLPVSFAVAV